jgi:hypothetical protein
MPLRISKNLAKISHGAACHSLQLSVLQYRGPNAEFSLSVYRWPKKTKPTLNWIKDGKKIAMKKKINIGCPILIQIYVFYLKRKF